MQIGFAAKQAHERRALTGRVNQRGEFAGFELLGGFVQGQVDQLRLDFKCIDEDAIADVRAGIRRSDGNALAVEISDACNVLARNDMERLIVELGQ